MSYLLDTNIFNQLLDGRIAEVDLPSDAQLLATYIQLQEIKNTKCQDRRNSLEQKFIEVDPKTVPVETSLWNVTPWGEGRYGGGNELFVSLLKELDEMNKAKANNYADALIAEVVLLNGYALITADQDLANLVESRGGRTVRFNP